MNSCIYIHLPFCIKKCLYCDFLSIPYNAISAAQYITALSTEFKLRRNKTHTIKTIYIGGGTPTTLAPLDLARLLGNLKEAFKVSSEAEITIEVNPGTIDKEKIEILLSAGINRFSVGIQSFNDRELFLLDRIHSASDGIRAIKLLRACGIKNLSIDLLYGIPGQTFKVWDRTLTKAIELSPEHISAYELTPEKDTPLHKALLQGKLEKPGEDTILEMYYHTLDALTKAGYRHYEISNFAKKGFESKHNINYWDRGEYIGLGAGAHSFMGGRRIKNTDDIDKYVSLLSTGMLTIEENTEVSCEEAIKEFIFLGLRKTEGLNFKKAKKDLGLDLIMAAGELIQNGLIEYDKEHLRLTREGIVISNTVIVRLFEELHLD